MIGQESQGKSKHVTKDFLSLPESLENDKKKKKMISNNIYIKSSQDQTLASKKETKNAIFTGPFPGPVSVDSVHMVCHTISSDRSAHPYHPAGTDSSICLPCLAMDSINKYSSKERRPSKMIHQGLFTFALSILIGFLWS